MFPDRQDAGRDGPWTGGREEPGGLAGVGPADAGGGRNEVSGGVPAAARGNPREEHG